MLASFSFDHIAVLAAHAAEYSFLLALLAALLGGELAVFALAFFAGQGVFPIADVIVGGFFGMLFFDAALFGAPHTKTGKKWREKGRSFEKYRALEAKIESLSHKSDIAILFISKILIGTRVLTLAYLSVRTIPLGRFLAYDAVAIFLWVLVLGGTGWFAGLGSLTIAAAYHDLRLAALFVISALAVFFLAIRLIRRWVGRE